MKSFWMNGFPTLPAIRRTAVTNKLSPVVTHPLLGPIICAKKCLLDADQAIAERKIVAANLASGCGSEITAVFRRLALSILKSDTTIKDNIRGKRLTAGWNLNKMKGILLAFQAA